MLTIKLEDNCADALAQMNITPHPGASVMVMRDSGQVMGVGVMHLYDEYAVIDSIEVKDEFKDFSLEYGLGKAMLNAIDLKGIRYAVSHCVDLEKQLRALRFKAPSEWDDEQMPDNVANWELCLNLDGYFTSNC
ncbi:MAG: hypothetical protein J6D26_06880 [Clostridia bacterium]|nr:hypothetical protein [Clostridia bacterium]